MSELVGFKHTHLAEEFERAQPEVAGVVVELGRYSAMHDLPRPIVTEIFRTLDMQEQHYTPVAKRLFRLLESGRELTGSDAVSVEAVKSIAISRHIAQDSAIRVWARARFSWHLHGCAIDLRNKHYTPKQRGQVFAFIRAHAVNGRWEVISHDIGRGDHFHIGVRDHVWRDAHPPSEGAANV